MVAGTDWWCVQLWRETQEAAAFGVVSVDRFSRCVFGLFDALFVVHLVSMFSLDVLRHRAKSVGIGVFILKVCFYNLVGGSICNETLGF